LPISGWPSVAADMWCGEFAPRGAGHADDDHAQCRGPRPGGRRSRDMDVVRSDNAVVPCRVFDGLKFPLRRPAGHLPARVGFAPRVSPGGRPGDAIAINRGIGSECWQGGLRHASTKPLRCRYRGHAAMGPREEPRLSDAKPRWSGHNRNGPTCSLCSQKKENRGNPIRIWLFGW
jgi:hypothetical protein